MANLSQYFHIRALYTHREKRKALSLIVVTGMYK